MNSFLRLFRGWWYRRLGSFSGYDHRKRLTGYERRWNLETDGFTKQGFFGVLKKNILKDIPAGAVWELAAGDGMVGSLGLWLESEGESWKVLAWEHRPAVANTFAVHRPGTHLFRGRRTEWNPTGEASRPVVVTARDSREAADLWRDIRSGRIAPWLVGIWNPSRRPLWHRRAKQCGYRLELVYERTEFYRRKVS